MGKIVFETIGSSRAVTWGMRCLRARTLNCAARTVRFSSSAWRTRTSRGCGPPRSVATRAASLETALGVCVGATFSIASYVAGVTLESRFASGARGVLGTGFWRRLTQPEIPSRKVAVKSKGHRRVIAGLILSTKKLLRAYQQRDRQRRFQ